MRINFHRNLHGNTNNTNNNISDTQVQHHIVRKCLCRPVQHQEEIIFIRYHLLLRRMTTEFDAVEKCLLHRQVKHRFRHLQADTTLNLFQFFTICGTWFSKSSPSNKNYSPSISMKSSFVIYIISVLQ